MFFGLGLISAGAAVIVSATAAHADRADSLMSFGTGLTVGAIVVWAIAKVVRVFMVDGG